MIRILKGNKFISKYGEIDNLQDSGYLFFDIIEMACIFENAVKKQNLFFVAKIVN